jgi:hypothetical protein
MRVTRLLGAGSTGGVYEGPSGGELFAVKIVEVLGPGDISKRQRLRSEFDIYGHLERAYSSETLARRTTPQCYGAFESKRLDALILDLHDGSLSSWDDLTPSEW